MNWKPGDMAIARSAAAPLELSPQYEGATVEIAGLNRNTPPRLCLASLGYMGPIWSVRPYGGDIIFVAEPNLRPIDDPDQYAEPRETELNRPCNA